MAGPENLKNHPKISVIVPCYQQAQYLSEALDSILNQTYQNWECVIVNDGSADDTETVASQYIAKDSRFKYLYKDNGGLSSARNEGIKVSEGEFILPLDADDKIESHYIEKALNVFNVTPITTLVYSKAKFFGTNNGEWNLRPYTYEELLKSNMIFCSSIFRKTSFDTAGGYDEQLKLGYEDWDLYIRMLNNESKIHQLNDFHFYYRIKPESMLKSIDQKKQEDLHYYLYYKHVDIYKAHFDSAISMLRKIDLYESMYKNSSDYKLGNKILNPIRSLLSLIKINNK